MVSKTILLYGRSNSGKTTQIGVLAEHVFKTSGKRTRLYTGDRGGLGSIQSYVDLGVIDVVMMTNDDPWIFLHKAVRGYTKDPATGKWVCNEEKNNEIGLWAFESLRSFAESLMADMAKKAGMGVNIGGGPNVSFVVGDESERLQVSGSNIAHYGVAQSRMTDEVWESQKLPTGILIWTSSVSKDDDTTSSGKVLGPDVVGKALTTEVPRWFNLTFRIDGLPAQGGKPERHILYLGSHVDVGAGNVAGLGNIRRPLDAPPLKRITIEPANIVEAIKLLEDGHDVVQETIKRRLEIK